MQVQLEIWEYTRNVINKRLQIMQQTFTTHRHTYGNEEEKKINKWISEYKKNSSDRIKKRMNHKNTAYKYIHIGEKIYIHVRMYIYRCMTMSMYNVSLYLLPHICTYAICNCTILISCMYDICKIRKADNPGWIRQKRDTKSSHRCYEADMQGMSPGRWTSWSKIILLRSLQRTERKEALYQTGNP